MLSMNYIQYILKYLRTERISWVASDKISSLPCGVTEDFHTPPNSRGAGSFTRSLALYCFFSSKELSVFIPTVKSVELKKSLKLSPTIYERKENKKSITEISKFK